MPLEFNLSSPYLKHFESSNFNAGINEWIAAPRRITTQSVLTFPQLLTEHGPPQCY